MTKERRAELRAWALSYLEYDDGDLPVLLREAPNDSDSTYITPDELRALLDSDERLEMVDKRVREIYREDESGDSGITAGAILFYIHTKRLDSDEQQPSRVQIEFSGMGGDGAAAKACSQTCSQTSTED